MPIADMTKFRQPDFNRLRTTLYNGRSDGIPVCELLHDIEVYDEYMQKDVGGLEDMVEFYYRAGYDYVPVAFNDPWGRGRGDLEREKEIYAEHRRMRKQRDAVSYSESAKGRITSLKEFEEHNWPDFDRPEDTGYFDQTAEFMPKSMKIIAWTNGIYESVSQAMGYERFCLDIYDNPELIRQMFEMYGRIKTTGFRSCAKNPNVGALWLADDLAYRSGLLFSPDIMREHLFPWYEELGAIAKEYDKPLILHSDGALWDILPELISFGFNAIQPIEPNSWDAEEVNRRYGDKICVMGTIDLDRYLCRGTVEEVRAEVLRHIRLLGKDGGFAVGTSNTPTFYMKMENYVAMLETAVTYRG